MYKFTSPAQPHATQPVVPPEPPKLPTRWVLIFLFSLVMGSIFGVLTLLQAGASAGILAGLAAAGTTVLGLNSILGD